MAPVISGDLAVTVDKQGSYVEITTTDLDITGYTTSSLFVLSTASFKGSLYLGSTLLAEDDTFTRAEYILNGLYYRHAGSDTVADSFGIIGREPPSDDTAESTVDVTISASNYGWLLRAVPNTNPPILTAYLSTKYEIDQLYSVWNSTHWGTAVVEEITNPAIDTWLQTILTKDSETFLPVFTVDARDFINSTQVFSQASELASELDKDAYATLKVIVATHGSQIELDSSVWTSLSTSEKASWEKIKTDLGINTTRRVVIPNADWYGSIDAARSIILSE